MHPAHETRAAPTALSKCGSEVDDTNDVVGGVSTSALLAAASVDTLLSNGWSLFQHQKDAVREILTRRRLLLAFDMGLGKTLISLVAGRAWQEITGSPVLVLCPVSVKAGWLKEAAIVGVTVTVHSWGSLPAPPPCAKSGRGGGYFLIADEAHYMQSMESKRTEGALRLCQSAACTVLATGTPLKNARPSNLFPLLRAIRHPLAQDQRSFELRYCAARKTRWKAWDVSGVYAKPLFVSADR
jgi:hypothetical protein